MSARAGGAALSSHPKCTWKLPPPAVAYIELERLQPHFCAHPTPLCPRHPGAEDAPGLRAELARLQQQLWGLPTTLEKDQALLEARGGRRTPLIMFWLGQAGATGCRAGWPRAGPGDAASACCCPAAHCSAGCLYLYSTSMFTAPVPPVQVEPEENWRVRAILYLRIQRKQALRQRIAFLKVWVGGWEAGQRGSCRGTGGDVGARCSG